MPQWDANLYMQFANERARPCADLIAHIALESPTNITDLGCGTGNSTEQLHARWPHSQITGVDSSTEMLTQAREKHPDWKWEQSDIEKWTPAAPSDLIFANAAFHWIRDHSVQLPRVFNFVAPGGALAFQIPYHLVSPAHHAMVEVAQFPEWEQRLRTARHTMTVETPDFYYDTLAQQSARLDIWLTTYHHEMQDASGIVEWLRGSGMRPYLEALANGPNGKEDQQRFQNECLRRFKDSYPPRRNGKTVLSYPRLFLIAYK